MSISTYDFDPGFAPYIMAFQASVEYLYNDINKFKNFSQRKTKFFQYHNKILELFYNNIGFYTGCLMWAAYLRAMPKGEITGNSYFGQTYNPEENSHDTQYFLKFIQLFPKDMKYFLSKDFSFQPEIEKLVNAYDEFLTINKDFTETKYNTDIELPSCINADKDRAPNYKNIIDDSIKSGKLSDLVQYINEVIE